jgi:hypothetical protein
MVSEPTAQLGLGDGGGILLTSAQVGLVAGAVLVLAFLGAFAAGLLINYLQERADARWRAAHTIPPAPRLPELDERDDDTEPPSAEVRLAKVLMKGRSN